MHKLITLILALCCYVAGAASEKLASADTVKLDTYKVVGPKLERGLEIEQYPEGGIPPYWTLVGVLAPEANSSDEAHVAVLREEGSGKLRKLDCNRFAVWPSEGKRFKLAVIYDGFIPVDLVKVDGKLRWVIVSG